LYYDHDFKELTQHVTEAYFHTCLSVLNENYTKSNPDIPD